MLKGKPIRIDGQELRSLPTYTIPEAAEFLAIPRRTLHSWYAEPKPLLVASGRVKAILLLSFQDLEEAYKLHLLRSKYDISFPMLRNALIAAREASGSDHPLLDSSLSVFRRDIVIHLPARGRRREQVVTLTGPPQLAVSEVVNLWGKRIVTGKVIFPWRYSENDESQPVALDPEVMSGRLVVNGTRIPVHVLRRRKLTGQSNLELAEDYDLTEDMVSKALMHIGVHKEAA